MDVKSENTEKNNIEPTEADGARLLADIKRESEEIPGNTPHKFFQRYEQSASYWAAIAHVVIFILLFALVGYNYSGLFTEAQRSALPGVYGVIFSFSRFAGTYWYIWIPVVGGIIICTYKYRKLLSVRHYAVIITILWALISIFSYLILSPVWLEVKF